MPTATADRRNTFRVSKHKRSVPDVRTRIRKTLALYRGHRYELRVSVAGKRRIFAIGPTSPHPTRRTSQMPVTRQDLTA
ncbi:hypothetical protein [Streptomyces sp. NPDC005970]|uniref:hypothetical protein n=1 Tax=Streptomyces sp. NPDC005970 TaxID=3156723 RepID=UPI0033E6C691